MSEFEDIFNRIKSNNNVSGIIIFTIDGKPIRSTFKLNAASKYSKIISELTNKASLLIKSLDNQDEPVFLRVYSLKHEILIVPDKEYFMAVVIDSNTDAQAGIHAEDRTQSGAANLQSFQMNLNK